MHQPAHFNMLSLSQAVHHVQGQSVYLRLLFLFYFLSLRAYIGENRYPGADTLLLLLAVPIVHKRVWYATI